MQRNTQTNAYVSSGKEEVNTINTPITDAYEVFLTSAKHFELIGQGYKQLFCIPVDELGQNEQAPGRLQRLDTIKQKLNSHFQTLGEKVVKGSPTRVTKPSLGSSIVLFSKENNLYKVNHRDVLNGVNDGFSRVKPVMLTETTATVYVMIAKKLPGMNGFHIIVRLLPPNSSDIMKEDKKRNESGAPFRATPPSGHPGLLNGDEPNESCMGAGEKYFALAKIVLMNNKTGSLHEMFGSVLTDEEQQLLAEEIFGHTFRKGVQDKPDGKYHVVTKQKGVCEENLRKDLEGLHFIEDFYAANIKIFEQLNPHTFFSNSQITTGGSLGMEIDTPATSTTLECSGGSSTGTGTEVTPPSLSTPGSSTGTGTEVTPPSLSTPIRSQP